MEGSHLHAASSRRALVSRLEISSETSQLSLSYIITSALLKLSRALRRTAYLTRWTASMQRGTGGLKMRVRFRMLGDKLHMLSASITAQDFSSARGMHFVRVHNRHSPGEAEWIALSGSQNYHPRRCAAYGRA